MEEDKNKDKCRIVVVEDEPAIRFFISDGLMRLGFLVDVAQDGQEALKKIKECKPDLIVTDAIMPLMNGFELCRILHRDETLKNIPIIFCTALSPDYLERQGVITADYLAKPFEITDLYRKVNALLKRAKY